MIRPFETQDEARVAEIWHRAGLAEYSYLPAFQALDGAQARKIFHDIIANECDIWLEVEGPNIRGFIALKASYVDRLYVDPLSQRVGVGKTLIHYAKTLQPQGLELHTHQQNTRACRFYQCLGFKAVKYGVSPPPELVADVEYHWRPEITLCNPERFMPSN